jgi:hypothetical protein
MLYPYRLWVVGDYRSGGGFWYYTLLDLAVCVVCEVARNDINKQFSFSTQAVDLVCHRHAICRSSNLFLCLAVVDL